ncbi:Carboxylesterase family protein [Algoriella xinjiangensis]|uniref:Carboxylesterase family protein n=1 Tax=Algoriella xinjiangensis TaxID=684065 RepID=A0A1I4W5P3_9FLAO|nr:alpha/beta hydrolase [Algoriella xinjiangensis]SFN08835.1 Carboxylesterase family protein [Algoriella xinjiangensis]VDH15689.1 Carboxylesterase family [Algoriella xinjiangensis]
MKYLVLILITFNFVYGQKTIVYDQQNNLAFDIYYPKNYKDNQSYNVFAWVHGGGFSGGTRTDKEEVERMKDAQERGFVSISISYRLLANSDEGFGCDLPKNEKLMIFKEASFDVLNALNYVQTNQKELKLSINKLILGGSSAGAETILNAYYLRDLWFGNQFNQVKIDGLVSYAGAIVDDRFVTKSNILPTVYVHGLSDDVVPPNNAPHRSCLDNQPGFFPLAGSQTLVSLNKKYKQSSLSIFSKSGKHEWSGLKKEYLNQIFEFINQSVINSDKINKQIRVN